ncbi:hypothetical protein [Kineococcus sp. SYSU DK001]|uniref:hypothetical protein n=1 Tax=Kineococcus sp. SYSU DK001 TaxID=3383122 RepID=UPI003D7E3DBB
MLTRSHDDGPSPVLNPQLVPDDVAEQRLFALYLQARAARTRARNHYVLGCVIAVVAAGIALAASDGGIVWTGGFLVAALLFVRAGKTMIAVHRVGLRTPLTAIAGVVVSACVVLTLCGVAGFKLIEPPAPTGPAATEGGTASMTGSCWSDVAGSSLNGEGDVEQVPCGSTEAHWRITAEVSSPETCASIDYLRSPTGEFYCLTAV